MTPPHATKRKGTRVPSYLRLLAAVAAVLMLTVGCSDEAPRRGERSATTTASGSAAGLAEGTCWTAALLGADPQDVLQLARKYDVHYLVAARALADRPSFEKRVNCADQHAVEVYKVVRLPKLDRQLLDYAAVLRHQTPLYDKVARSVSQACMTTSLAKAAATTGLPGAVMEPMLPAGASLGWAPASPEQWSKGQRVFACTLTWTKPQSLRYRAVFTRAFPTGKRTCIDSRALVFVDCARRHDRERIAVIEARDAVAAGAFPGPKAIRTGPDGRYLEVSDARYKALDAACTAYLKSVSTTKKLTGIANVDVDEWPAPGGSYPIYCEADRRPDQESLVTEGSVYNR